MFNSLRTSFHLSQATVQQETEHVAHHRPLGLLLVLTLIAWQSGVFSAFAAALPIPTATKQAYVYIQSSPLTDDAWIGTRVYLPTTPVLQTIQPSLVPVRTQPIDTSWLGNFTKKPPVTPVVTQTAPYPVMPIVYTTPNGTPLNNISSSYSAPAYVSLVSSVFGRNGAVMGQSGDYTTSLVTEGTNLYFTDTRAQNALSGTLNALSGNITTLSGQTAANMVSIWTLSGNLATTNSDLLSLSGTVANKIGLTALSATGPLTYNNTTGVFGIDLANSTTTGAISATDWNTFNSKETVLTFGTGITRIGDTVWLTTGADGDILSMASGVPTWITPATVSVPVLSVFGRTGSILATLGDYTTSLVTEGSNLYFTQGRFDTAFSGKTTTNLTEGANLYFTDTRAQDALSGSLANIGNSINTLSGSLVALSSTVDTLSGVVANNYAILSGALAAIDATLTTTNSDLATLSGTVNTLSGFVSTLSTTVSSISGSLVALSSTVDTLSGSLALTDADVSSISGALAALTTTVNTLSGTVSTILSDVSTLSGSLAITDANLVALSGSLVALSSTVDTLSGSLLSTIATLGSLSTTVTTHYTTLSGALTTTNATLATLSGTVAMVQGDVSTLSGQVALLQWLSHDALTLGTANGLSLAAQQLSLALASATTTGALSATDWTTFNNKENVLSAGTSLQYYRGDKTWQTLNTSVIPELTNLYYTTARANTDFDTRLATKSTSNLTEGTNLYFTNLRAQNALSGTILGINTSIATTNSNLATATGNIATLSGNLSTISTDITTLSGQTASNSTNIWTLSGSLATTNTNLATAIGNLATLSGTVANKIWLTALFAGGGVTYNNATGVFGWNGTTTNVAEGTNLYYTTARANTDFDTRLATKSTSNLTEGTNLYFTNLRAQNALSGTVNTLSGNIATATTNIATLSGQTANNTTNIWTLSGNLATTNSNIFSLSGSLTTTNSNLSTLSGTVANKIWLTALSATGPLTYNNTTGVFGIGQATTSTNGYLSSTDWNAFNTKQNAMVQATTTASGWLSSADWNTFSNKIWTIAIANGLSIAGTGISLALASTTTTGALSSIDWNTFNNKESVLTFGTGITRVGNTVGLTNTGITFAIGTTGTDMNWSTAFTALGGTAMLNIPDASLTARGLVSTGSQVFAGSKTFATAPTLSGFTLGSVLFASTGGLITQDNTNFFFNITSKRLGIGTATPVASLELRGTNVTAPNNTGAITNAIFRMRGNTNHSLDFGTFNNSPYGAWIQSVDHANMSNNLPLALNPNGGNVGIGISAPTATLHVQNNLLTTTNLLTLTATGLTTGNALQIIGTGSRSLLRISQENTDPLDVERVTIGQGGISATKPDSLARDQLYVFGRINSSWDHYLADFLWADVPRGATDGTTAEGLIWDAGGATPAWSASNIVGISGARRIGLSATINASAFLGNYTMTESSLNPVYEARAIINAANATTRAFVGFTDRAQNIASLATDTNNSTNEIFFRKKAGTTTWETVTRSTANATEVVTATAVPVNQLNIFRIEVLGASQTVKFFINGTLVATHTGTTVPALTIRFGHQIGMLVTAATLNTMDIDYIRMWSDDPASVPASENIPGTASYVSDLFVPKTDTTILEAVEITTTKNTLRALDTMIDATGTGKVDLTQNVDLTDDDMSLADAGTYFLQILKAALERLSDIWLDMQLTLRSLVADEVKTEKLCLGETCITEDELKALLQSRGIQSSSSSVSSGNNAPATETTTGSTDSGASLALIDETPVETFPVDTVSTGSTDATSPVEPTPVVESAPVVDASGTVAP